MISILIPVYNTPVEALVRSLSGQVAGPAAPAEILVLDDGSDEVYRSANRPVAALPHVRYEELPQNVGRLVVRQRLAEKARFPWLLFLDGDSAVVQPAFLANYVKAIDSGAGVYLGGRIYQAAKPAACALMLHWTYGRNRENIVDRRKGFLTNNFCIGRSLFSSLNFPVHWKGYGHEDTLMGIELERAGAVVAYLHNPVLHEGLETAIRFLKKADDALANLSLLTQMYDEAILRRHVRLYRAYRLVQGTRLAGLVKMLVRKNRERIERNLSGCRPSLFLFDLYRLAHFCERQA